jgi:hypothetical protein
VTHRPSTRSFEIFAAAVGPAFSFFLLPWDGKKRAAAVPFCPVGSACCLASSPSSASASASASAAAAAAAAAMMKAEGVPRGDVSPNKIFTYCSIEHGLTFNLHCISKSTPFSLLIQILTFDLHCISKSIPFSLLIQILTFDLHYISKSTRFSLLIRIVTFDLHYLSKSTRFSLLNNPFSRSRLFHGEGTCSRF